MNTLKTLYLPTTDIYSIRQFPIFLLFQNIHLIQPVEKNPDITDPQERNNFSNSSYCQVHTPSPLGEHRDRFLHLVEDIRGRKDDYAAQLSSLTLAAMSKAQTTGEGSERDIIKAIFTPEEIQNDGAVDKKRAETLWNSRLVLAIAEILDREEEEIAQRLASLEDDQAGLFKNLQGDDSEEEENPFSELIQVEKNLGAADSGNARKRFAAWNSLFLESGIEDIDLLLTTSGDTTSIIQERYEKNNDNPSLTLPGFSLPGLIGWNVNDGLEAVTAFAEENESLLRKIGEVIQTFTAMKSPTIEQCNNTSYSELMSNWQIQLEKSFPISQFGRLKVDLCIFPGTLLTTLLGMVAAQTTSYNNGILFTVG